MNLPSLIFCITIVVFFVLVIYKSVKKTKESPKVESNINPTPTVSDTKDLDTNFEEVISPETAVVLPEVTPTPITKEKPKKARKDTKSK